MLLTVVVAGGLPSATAQQASPSPAPAVARAWPPGTPELPADPALHFGQLDNGVRFVWLHNERPPGRCAIRLVVQVGSLDEADDERGMAHFVEHMAFNGTRRFPGNSIDDWFRAHGMRVGQHANAFTSMDDTTYGVDLPDHDEATIRDGLDVLRQFADGVLFAPDEVEQEKGVVDAEDRERRTPAELADEACFGRLLAGSRRAERHPLGSAAGRAGFTAERLRAFHERWYRADNLVLVLVGDLAGQHVDELCRSTFGSMATPSTPLPARAPIGLPDLAESSFAIEQPGRSDVEWFVQRLTAQPASPGTSETLRRSVLHEAAAEMARWLIDDALDQDGSPVMDVDVAPAAWADELPGFVVRFRSEPDRSAAALAECGRALRALHVSEFSARLLGRVRERKLAQFERDLGRSGRVENVVLARWLAVCIADRVVPCALSFLLQRRRAAWNELTAEACAVEWFTAWGDEQPSILTIGPPGHGIDTSAVWQRIAAVAAATGPEDLAALRDAQAASGDSAVAVAAAADWPYASSPVAPAEVSLQRRHDNALDLDDLQFANGVRVLVKATDFARDQILIAVCVGAGQSHLTDDERQAARLFDLMVPEAGLRRLAAAELRLVASTRDARVSVRTEPGRFLLRGACDRASLAFQFEWLVAQLSEPRFDAVVHRRVCASHRSEFAPTRASATSVEMEFSSRLTGQPVGYAPARVAAVDLDAVRALFAAHWRDEPITVVVVGDLDVEQTIGLVAQTFGRRPLCRPAAEPAANVDDRAAPNVLHEVHEIAASETSSAVTVLAPLPDLRGVAMSRALVLALIVQDRLRAMLRESMGATYAGRAEVYEFATASRALVIRAAAKVAPGREQDVRDAMLHVLAAMGSDGVTAVELDGVRALVQNELRAQDRNNDYWCQRLSLVHREPAMLHEWTASADDLETLTAADLSALAATYFAPGRLSSLVLKAEPR